MKKNLKIAILYLVICCSSYSFGGLRMSEIIPFPFLKGMAFVDPVGLAISFQSSNLKPENDFTTLEETMHRSAIVITNREATFQSPVTITEKDKGHEIIYNNGFRVIITNTDNSLNFKIYPSKDTIINWPNIVEDARLQAYLIPEGEGLFVPVKDKELRTILSGSTYNHMNMMPFIGYIYDDFSITNIIHTPYRTSAEIHPNGLSFNYDFHIRDKQPCYEATLVFSKSDLLEPSKIFKEFLKKQNQYVTLKEKIRLNPKIETLAGAIHIYVWGDGRTIKALEALKNIGIKKAWIGYEEKPSIVNKDKWNQTDYVTPEFIKYGVDLGYLIGGYDSYHTMQAPENSDCYNDNFGKDFFPSGCVRNEKGEIVVGFGGRGCYVSMTALNQADNLIIHERIKKFKSDGVNSYFLDCHGTLEAFDDYSTDHPQTILNDIAIRLQHMDWLSRHGLVLGSESAHAYAVPFLAFSHGNFSAFYGLHWSLTKDKSIYGGWYPSKRPEIFFKALKANKDYTLRYNPKYRIPLFEAVFHESIVVTDRWEIPLVKFPNLYQDRFLLEFLYGVPSMWDLDLKDINKYSAILMQLAQEFTPFHSKIMEKSLTNFEYLTEDRLVQKTIFGNNEVIVIANFRNEPYEGIPTKSLKIIFSDSNEIKIITPAIK